MPADEKSLESSLALSTKVEEDFVSPLTAVRGSLEILRDFPDLAVAERQRFVETALRSCARLQKGVEQLSKAVYAAGQQTHVQPGDEDLEAKERPSYESRIHFLDEVDAVELDLTDLEFSSSTTVNEFYDVVEKLVGASGREWYFLVNYSGCSIWPEAWVAFAHRGKKVNVGFSRGTVRYTVCQDSECEGRSSAQSEFDPDLQESREAALAKIAEMKAAERS